MDSLSSAKKQCIDFVASKYLCRNETIGKLYSYFGLSNLPSSLFLFGDIGTGKTTILTEFLKFLPIKSVNIDCIECYTSKIVYETILNQLFDHELVAKSNYAPFAKCENVRIFLEALVHNYTNDEDPFIILFDNAERLRDMDANVLELFLRLQEMTVLNVCCIFVSTIPMEKMYPKESFPIPFTIYWPKYTKQEILQILMSKYPHYKEVIASKIRKNASLDENSKAIRIRILENLDLQFFENYLNIFLNTFFRTCRDLKELLYVSRDCFEKYCEPILDRTVEPNDARKLYNNIINSLKSALVTIYKRFDQNSCLVIIFNGFKLTLF